MVDAAAAAAAQEATEECLRRERLYCVPDPIELKQVVLVTLAVAAAASPRPAAATPGCSTESYCTDETECYDAPINLCTSCPPGIEFQCVDGNSHDCNGYRFAAFCGYVTR